MSVLEFPIPSKLVPDGQNHVLGHVHIPLRGRHPNLLLELGIHLCSKSGVIAHNSESVGLTFNSLLKGCFVRWYNTSVKPFNRGLKHGCVR